MKRNFYWLNASEITIAALSKGQLSPAPTQHCTPFPRRLDKAAQTVTAWAEFSQGLVLTTTSMDMGIEGRILLSWDAFVIPLNLPWTVGKFNFLRCPTTARSAHQLCSCMKTPFPGWEQVQKSLIIHPAFGRGFEFTLAGLEDCLSWCSILQDA